MSKKRGSCEQANGQFEENPELAGNDVAKGTERDGTQASEGENLPKVESRPRFKAPACKYCGSEKTRVNTTRGPKRYCVCDDCGGDFVAAGPIVKRPRSETGARRLPAANLTQGGEPQPP